LPTGEILWITQFYQKHKNFPTQNYSTEKYVLM
jgi:hypothetical protein